jgi:hypothetical protein
LFLFFFFFFVLFFVVIVLFFFFFFFFFFSLLLSLSGFATWERKTTSRFFCCTPRVTKSGA